MDSLTLKINTMLFYLTKSLVVEPKDTEYISIYQAVHNLASSVISCNHLLAGDLEALIHFKDIFKNDLIVYPLFNKLYQNYATEPIPTCLTYYIEIVKDNPHPRYNGHIEVQQILYSDLMDSDHCVKSQLVCEDLNDGAFFIHVLEWYINKTRNNISFALHKVDGGGRNTYRAIENEIKDKHCTISIVDTDMKYQTDIPAVDSTCSLCANLRIDSPIYNFLPLQVHETENLIPLNYINEFDIWTNGSSNDKINKKAFDYLRIDAENVLPYFDYKKGIKKNDFYNNNPDFQIFARHCFSLNLDYITAYSNFEAYVDCIGKDQWIYPCLIGGSGVMTRLIDMIENNNAPEPELLNFQENNWNMIGQNLLNWCVARNQESIH